MSIDKPLMQIEVRTASQVISLCSRESLAASRGIQPRHAFFVRGV